MTGSAFNPTVVIDKACDAPPTLAVVRARCLRCGTDLSRLARAGRYCPHCGLDTYSSPPAALRARATEATLPGKSAATEWRHLAEVSLVRAQLPPPPIMAAMPSSESTSQILRGYSNALYSLGRRYEIGARNRREAIRCYMKSARLGNFMAFARLASRWLEASDGARDSAVPPTVTDKSPADST